MATNEPVDVSTTIASQALLAWLNQSQEGRAILARFHANPHHETLALTQWLQARAAQAPTQVATYITGGQVERLINIAHAGQVVIQQSPPREAALERVRRLSEIAAKDARLIAEDPDGALGGEIRLDQNLYVTRSVEQEIHSYLSGMGRRNASWVLVVGEAGYGKTSLLWHFHHMLNASDKWEPWFVKSTSFWRHTSILSAEELAFAAEATRGQERRPIVLLDTVDLLLHDENDRYGLLELLSLLNDRGCFVIATCRPQEASLLRPAEPASVYLGQYNDTELAEAVDKHVARFCTASAPRQREEHLQRIKDAVARGLPIREVCTNPLTLRMLFTLYAPEEIHPSEINIFKLYQEYWDARVKQDRRAGSPISPEASTNLETTAAGVALAMLAEGTPELDHRLLPQALRELGGSPKEVRDLVSRGVLYNSEIGTVSFFHQTFFEHSAARGMLTRLGAKGLAILDERMQWRPNDPFLSPIYEQALLLSETEIVPIRQKADTVLLDLIQRASHSAKSSGIYVYAHRHRVSDTIVRAVQELLAAGDSAIADRFLEVAPNIAEPRLQTLFEELDIIWNRGTWQEQEHMLDLLERLAARDPEGVRNYLERHDVLTHVLAQPADFPGDRKLLRVLSILANFDPGWSWAWILRLYAQSLRRARSRTLQTIIINTLCERALVFGASDIATRFEAAISHVQDAQMGGGVSELSRASGRLWVIQWRASNYPLSDLLNETATMSDGFGLWARMNGLSELLLTADESEVALAVAHLRSERETSRQWRWAKFVLPQLLRGNQGPSPPLESPSKRSIPPAVQYGRKEAARILAEWKTDEASNLPILFRHAVELAALPPPTLLELLDSEELAKPAPWLAEEGFARLLADAFLAGHLGASQAMALLKADPIRHKKVVSIVSSRLAEYPPTEPRVADTVIELVLRVEDETRLLRVIRQLAPPVPVALQTRVQELNAFRQRLVASKSEQKRCRGVSLWIQLLRLELSSPPPLAELRARFEHEKTPQVRAWFADLIGQSAAKGGYDIEMVVDILAPLVKEKDENVREKSFAALMTAITETPGAPPAFALAALDIALTPPTHAGRPRLFGWLIERLLPEHVDIAAALIEKLVAAPGIVGLGSQGKRDLIAYLRSPVRALIRRAPPHVQERLLNTVVQLDRFLGRLIIDAICHEAFAAMAERLNMLLEQDVPGEIKELIRLHKYYRERTVGGEGWPELYNRLRYRSQT